LFDSNGQTVKKLAILSDTHDHMDRIAKAVDMIHAHGAEALLHLGDFVAPFALKAVMKFNGPLYAIYGNNDGEKKGLKNVFPELKDGPCVFELGGRKLGVAHSVEEIPAEYRGFCDGIFYGHSHARLHIPKDAGRPLELNPGEGCGWLTGKPSFALLDLELMTAELVDID